MLLISKTNQRISNFQLMFNKKKSISNFIAEEVKFIEKKKFVIMKV